MASEKKGFDTIMSNTNLNQLAKRYSVDIRELGWINCDRFYQDNSPRIEYIVNLGDTASPTAEYRYPRWQTHLGHAACFD